MASDLYSVRKKYGQKKEKEAKRVSPRGAMPETDVVTPALNALSYPQRKLKEAISGNETEWFSPEGLPVPVYAAGNTLLDLVADPLNLIGGGLFTSGVKGARRIAGADSLKGNTMSAASNWIDNFYVPSKTAVPTKLDEFIVNNKKPLSTLPKIGGRIGNLENAQQSADMRERAGSFVNWLADASQRGIEQTISPSARALYRDQQITGTMQDKAGQALESNANRAVPKAVAQVQATENIGYQSVRDGAKSQDVQDIVNRSFLTEPVKATEGSYKGLIKDNKLQGTYEKSGRAAPVTDKDLDIIDQHVRTVWKDRKDRSISETPTADIRIKNPGSGDQVTGSHRLDFFQKSKVFSTMNSLYKKNYKPTVEETWSHLKDSNLKLHPKSKTLEDARKNGIWVTGSFSGSAITEGGVNFIAKISPNGRVMAVVSDEHNFLEKIPAVGRVLEDALPNRSLSVTPPMHFDVKKTKENIKDTQPKDKKNVTQSLQNIADATPDPALLRQERKVNVGAGMVGAGMLTGDEKGSRSSQ